MNPEELIARFGEQQVVAFLLVLGRVSPLFLLAPLFSSRSLPLRAKGIAAVGLAIGLTPVALRTDRVRVPLEVFVVGELMVKEILVGLAFAFVIGALFHALATAGSLLDTLIGFSFGGLVDPVTGNQSTLIMQLYSMVGVLVFIAINGDAWMIRGLARTYELVPLLDAPALGSMVQGVQIAFAGVFAAAFQVAAPVLLALLITDAALGVVSRVVPQLNVFAVGFPAKVTVGLILVGASLPFVAGWLSDELQRSVGTALDALKVG
jgi:flagellar biosynthetic protein FliR